MNEASSEDDLIEQLMRLCCRYRRFPTRRQMVQARHEEPTDFCAPSTFDRLGKTNALRAAMVVAALSARERLDADQQFALDVCLPIAEEAESETTDPDAKLAGCGYVYLFRDRKAYKIGNSTDPESRRAALQTGNPRRITLVHRILTDDPKGIEDYWHRRFSDSRIALMDQGESEWFHLSREDVAVFRARVRM